MNRSKNITIVILILEHWETPQAHHACLYIYYNFNWKEKNLPMKHNLVWIFGKSGQKQQNKVIYAISIKWSKRMKLVPLHSHKTWPTNNSHDALTTENLVTLVMKNSGHPFTSLHREKLTFSLKPSKKKNIKHSYKTHKAGLCLFRKLAGFAELYLQTYHDKLVPLFWKICVQAIVKQEWRLGSIKLISLRLIT